MFATVFVQTQSRPIDAGTIFGIVLLVLFIAWMIFLYVNRNRNSRRYSSSSSSSDSGVYFFDTGSSDSCSSDSGGDSGGGDCGGGGE